MPPCLLYGAWGEIHVSGQCAIFRGSMRVRYQETYQISLLHLLWRRYCVTCDYLCPPKIRTYKALVLSTLPYTADCARRWWGPWEFPHEVPATDSRHQMAEPRQECWSHKPDRSYYSNGSDQIVKRRNSIFGHIAKMSSSLLFQIDLSLIHIWRCRRRG